MKIYMYSVVLVASVLTVGADWLYVWGCLPSPVDRGHALSLGGLRVPVVLQLLLSQQIAPHHGVEHRVWGRATVTGEY